ncbi:hypothetical protein Smp_169400 [Schistosoma mansoni]|uniref:hypothetical protein n=1 Tax=Schistosoma mansoni TaxID=6183 RepID=UPI00022C8397|nr:hypothetical protein Smp_169400 [Schistosoma mansoni]|eukprot:XP_018646077.1 hypothetical protein Smp_169400 [Schistosoma mansoni]
MDCPIEDIDKKDPVVEQNTDVNFVYNDTDEYSVEIAELYSYSEEPEFHINRECFEKDFHKFVSVKWFEASNAERHSHIQRLLDHLESSDCEIRQRATRSLLYLLQGNFGDCELEEDQITWARHNVYLCIESGLLQAIIELLLFEIHYDSWGVNSIGNDSATNNTTCNGSTKPGQSTVTTTIIDTNQNSTVTSTRQSNITMKDSANLRVLLSILYIMVETVRDGMLTDHTQQQYQQTVTVNDKHIPITTIQASNDPMAKLREQFVEDLAMPIEKDGDLTLTAVLFGMIHRFCSGIDPHFPMKKVLLLLWKVLLITLGPLSNLLVRKNQARARYGLPPVLEDSVHVIQKVRASSPPVMCITDQSQSQSTEEFTTTSGFDTPRPSSPVSSDTINHDDGTNNRDTSDLLTSSNLNQPNFNHHQVILPGLSNLYMDEKSLPWKPKVKKKDLEVGESIPNTPVERLYRSMYPLLPQYMIGLLKILLAASPTSRTKTESINILAEMTPETMP